MSFPTPGDLPDPGFKPMSLSFPAFASGFFTTAPLRKPPEKLSYLQNRLIDIKKKKKPYGYQRGRGGGDKLGIWDYEIHITIYKIDKQQGPTV